jgi:hypothetical protein
MSVPVSQGTQSVSILQAGRLVLLKEIISVPSEKHKKCLNKFCGQNTESLNITDGGTYNCHWALADFLRGGGRWVDLEAGETSSVVMRMNVQSLATGPCLHVPASPCSIRIMQAIKGSEASLCTACPSAEN